MDISESDAAYYFCRTMKKNQIEFKINIF